ncbi:2-amino-4-hydroxy-6-hydroxymethyldihydropteridine diphosphokinase [Providencia vermicola]|uniref:2-amino-4-hydroxy-6-hydroxymethyldihydropteridine pyrophosphokinase n=2 Tax=Providencia TaxID=586 RepID=A0AAI9I081_PROST|nr:MULTISPECIES: 2-amino-4-hydroxy-6-hydroxymethyldihydropteridine diphosphokinase [Providencia]ELR5043041.1 2-amino-4-hydroxy-6-hydroxymethyldihydropteridine diphosphokinase [Providencia rettgeri]ELR5035899.1 2-amino-4-hydroxy-6-hydroxymethyldihydropteridine diphosphokinase [Providencia stuartii]ELR5121942.1 2-amino-4-hydroxy-6-hydroxymethyldihydropteridine diphosphokinase [Providencia stuartii]ELR5140792.1 2-amino-4-hydroxy-6-hydroxymethyldihydropteridine diphosphokinase [Providencia stuartii
MELVYIAIGSNLGEPLKQAQQAIEALNAIPKSRVAKTSSIYRTKPLGPQDQNDFLNIAVLLETELEPETLLDHTQRIELELGRVRKAERWGPRTLDLDIMLFGHQVINTPRLTVPHYGLKEREFMLYPLYEIAPNLIFPDGEQLSERLTHVPRNGLTYWDITV